MQYYNGIGPTSGSCCCGGCVGILGPGDEGLVRCGCEGLVDFGRSTGFGRSIGLGLGGCTGLVDFGRSVGFGCSVGLGRSGCLRGWLSITGTMTG
jgi:hypothetical protein